jgi:GNAT superfamily N-acetyltransferase
MTSRTVTLSPVTDDEYHEIAELQVLETARQLELAGEVPAVESRSEARLRLAELLADELRGAGHDFFVARAPNLAARVGWVWIAPAPSFLGPNQEHTRWLSQITVEEPHRGRGLGRATFVALERHLAQVGVKQLWLRVFDWNTVARSLYDSVGFELVRKFPNDSHLRKQIAT